MARQDSKPRRGRSGWDVLTGLCAIAVLLVLLIGPPVALITVFGLPVPHTMPSASLLTHRLQAAAVLKACSVVVWLAWLQLVWCVVAEVSAAVRNIGMPRRVPLAGGIQALVHRLVTTALLVSTAAAAAPALAPAAALAATPPAATAPPAVAVAHTGARYAGPGSAIPGQSLPPALLVAPAANGGAHRLLGPADVSQEFRPVDGSPGGNGTQATAASPDGGQNGQDRWAHRTEKIYVVKPPAGRFHESLWEIAENHLGDGRRYREIFELNKDLPQPDGSMLTIASLIRPGWVLRMPHDAHGPGIEEVRASPPARHSGRPHEPRPAAHPPAPGKHASSPAAVPPAEVPPAVTPPTQAPPAKAPPAARTPAAPAPAAPAPAARAPATPAPDPGGPAHATPPPGSPAAPAPAANGRAPAGQPAPGRPAPGQPAPAHAVPRSAPGYPLELAAAGLLAAGVLVALERRRRRQARRRPPGRRVVAPQPDAAWAEAALRLGEDESSARVLDAGLRHLSRALQRQGRTPPTVFAAHVGDDNLDLWVNPPSDDVPAPWYAVGDGQVWRLPQADVPGLDGHGTALYPGLVTIGTDATGRVLVDLEAARGPIAVTGPEELVADVLCAMATELATSLWSDTMHLTLVGAGDDLAVLMPDRVHVAGSVAKALPLLEAHAAGVAHALAASGAGSVLAGRAEGLIPEAWTPHYLITLIPPTPQEAQRLAALGRAGCLAAGYLVAGEIPGAAWTWEVTPDGQLRAAELGLDVTAQLIPAQQQAAVAGLFDAADDMTGAPMSAPPADAAPAPHLAPDATMPAEVTLLGPVSVRATGEIEPGMLPLATEIVVYLATHPAGVHANVLARAIWPQGVADETRDAVLDEVAYWLGTDGIGRPHLAADASGRLRLGSGVKVDWHVFLTLVAQAGQAAGPGGKGSHGGHAAEEAKLAQALSLVDGHFLAGCGPGGYSWIVTDGLEYEVSARVADAAHRLCELRLNDGDSRGAMDAVRTGLRIAPDDELLWRDLLTAAHATGQENMLYAAAGEIWTRASMDGPPELTTETEALLDELLPTWRWTLA